MGGNFLREKNAYGETTGETNRVGDRQSYTYDKEGRVTGQTAWSGKGVVKEYRDAQGRETTRYGDGSSITVIRDAGGNIVRAEGETGVIRYAYDRGFRPTEQVDEGSGERTEYGYDGAGRRVRMVNGNRDVRYRYGKNGELERVYDNSQRLDVRYEYDVTGREVRRLYGNGVKQETSYDGAGRVILIREMDSGNRLIRGEGYVYDERGRRTHRVDESGRITKYEYDNQSRLKTALYPWTEEKAGLDRKEAEEAGLYFTPDKGVGERYTFTGA